MKATGVVRRIDDLGRIVIPKEIRRNFKISEGDSLEIFVDSRGIVLKKYSVLDEMIELSGKIVESINKNFNKNILITDKEKIVAVPRELDNLYLNKELSSLVKEKIDERNTYLQDSKISLVLDSSEKTCFILNPMIINSDAVGSVIIISNDFSDEDRKIVNFVESLLVKNG